MCKDKTTETTNRSSTLFIIEVFKELSHSWIGCMVAWLHGCMNAMERLCCNLSKNVIRSLILKSSRTLNAWKSSSTRSSWSGCPSSRTGAGRATRPPSGCGSTDRRRLAPRRPSCWSRRSFPDTSPSKRVWMWSWTFLTLLYLRSLQRCVWCGAVSCQEIPSRWTLDADREVRPRTTLSWPKWWHR